MKRYFLEIVVFLCGAVVMVYEIVGSRVLGPYLGTSIFIWTSLIGIILGSLSLGYWLGGLLADRKPSFSALAWIVLASATMIGFTTLVKEPFLTYLPRFVTGLKWQSVIASLFLFAPASAFLGMVSPYAVRLKITALQTSGTTVGQLYAISTVGSIAGTFAAGFYLIPAMGTTNILYCLAILLAIISILLFIPGRKIGKASISLIFILLTSYSFLKEQSKARNYLDEDTQYNRVWIYDATDQASGKPIKFMRINNESSSAMFLDNDDLVFPYLHYYRLAEYFTPDFSTSLILGGAGYSFPKYYIEKYPGATIDVVEIDEELTKLSHEYFRLMDNPRMKIFHEDGRTFLNRAERKYDVIYGDTYKSLYTIPWHLTTLEAAGKCYDMLNEGGCILINIISAIQGDGSLFLQAEFATYRAVFPEVLVFAVDKPENLTGLQSIMLVAVKSSKPFIKKELDPELSLFLTHDVTDEVGQNVPVLTDEMAPVDYYMNKVVR